MSNTERVLRARIQAVDNYTQPMRRVIAQTRAFQSVANRIRPVILRARDMASRVLNPVRARIEAIRAIPQVQTILRAVDMATNVIKRVASGLKGVGGMVVKATVKVADKASGILDSIKGKLIAISLATVTIGAKVGVQSLGEEQTQKITINRVIENSGKSKEQAKKQTDEYYKYLEEYANKTPFSTSSVAQFGTKAMMMSKGSTDQAKVLTDQMGNVKAFVGKLKLPTCCGNVA